MLTRGHNCPQRATTSMRSKLTCVLKEHWYMSSDDVRERRSGTLVVNGYDINTRFVLELLHDQMLSGTPPRSCVAEFAWVGTCKCDELAYGGESQ